METVNVSSVDNVFNLHFEKNPFLVFDDDIVWENLNPHFDLTKYSAICVNNKIARGNNSNSFENAHEFSWDL